MKNILIIICFFLIASCREEIKIGDSKVIIVPENEIEKMNHSDLFKSFSIIPLETKEESLISTISKIYFYKNRLYILDYSLNTLFIFSEKGKYLNKISSIGNGPKEYISLLSFSINENKDRLVLYSDRPSKFLFYTLEGSFISEINSDIITRNFEIIDNNIVQFAYNLSDEFYFHIYNERGKSKRRVKIPKKIKRYRSQITAYPNSSKSINNYFYSTIDYNIYSIKNKKVHIPYRLDFGEKNIKQSFFRRRIPPENLYRYTVNSGYAAYISNFRETNKFIIFKYEPGKMVFYDKKSETSMNINVIMNDSLGLDIGNYFAHNGRGENIITIHQAQTIKMFLDGKKTKSEEMNNLLKDISYYSNPILFKYELKRSTF